MKAHQHLVDRLGGASTVHAAVDELYQRIMTDDALASYFDGVDMAVQRGHMTDLLLAVLAAPALGPRLAEANRLRTAHGHLRITDDAFDQTAGHLIDTLAALRVDPGVIDDVIEEVAALRPQVVSDGFPAGS